MGPWSYVNGKQAVSALGEVLNAIAQTGLLGALLSNVNQESVAAEP